MEDAPIRVLQIVTYMSKGGLETMLMNYYRHIDRGKIQFDFLEHRQENTEYDKEIEVLGGRIYRLPELNPFSKKYRNKTAEFFINHPEYRIVHSHINSMSGLSLAYARKAGVPVRIAHSHNTKENGNWKYPIKKYYKEKIKNVATDRMACGCEAGKWLFGEKDFFVLNNAIDTEKFLFQERYRKQYREAFHIKESDFVIGHVGRFFHQKNHTFLLDIFRETQKIVPESKLLLVGDGPLQKNIRQKALEYGLQNHMIFVGISDKVGELLSAIDAFVLPSFYEGLPVSLIEAQASGLKCFISDVISKEAVLTDDVIMLGLGESAERWAEEIYHVSKAYERKCRKNDLLKAGYDAKSNVKRLEDYYINKWTKR